MGVLELGGDPNLAEEPLRPYRGGDVGIEHLDGDCPLVSPVVREEDERHATASQLAFDDIALTQGLLDLMEEIAHSGR